MLTRTTATLLLTFAVAAPYAAAAEQGTTRTATITTSSRVGSTTLPRPFLNVDKRALSPRSTEYTTQGRTVQALSNQVDTATVCQYPHPGRRTDLHFVHEVTDENLIQPDPRSKITIWVDWALTPRGPWRALGHDSVRYDWTLNPVLSQESQTDVTVVTDAGRQARTLYLRVRSRSVLEGNIVSFAESLRIDC